MNQFLLMVLGCVCSASAMAAIPVQFWMLDNGAKVYLMHAPGLPMVDVQLEFDAGSRRDGKATAGLAQATALMMSKGVKADGMSSALDENQLGRPGCNGVSQRHLGSHELRPAQPHAP
jgi:zinc protease